MMPNDTAELAWDPNAVPEVTIIRGAARASRLVSFI
jgi:hypothetical protein